jgi:hypothetical protein
MATRAFFMKNRLVGAAIPDREYTFAGKVVPLSSSIDLTSVCVEGTDSNGFQGLPF